MFNELFGLPYFTNRISINSEQDIVNIRLINICPPQALRPYFQEGYLVGTADITTDYEKKTDLDLKNRLIAKFKIFNTPKFWGTQKSLEEYLIPRNDEIEVLCKQIKEEIKEQNNIEAMFPGVWRNDFEFENGTSDYEPFKIINGNEYFCYGKVRFKLDNIFIDKSKGILKFRKAGVGTDTRKAFNELQIVDANKYKGFETPGTKIKYTRIE